MTSINDSERLSVGNVELARSVLGFVATRCTKAATSSSCSGAQRRLLGALGAKLSQHHQQLKQGPERSNVLHTLEVIESFLHRSLSDTDSAYGRQDFQYLRELDTSENSQDNSAVEATLISNSVDQLQLIIDILTPAGNGSNKEPIRSFQKPFQTTLPSRRHSREFENTLCHCLDAYSYCSCGDNSNNENHLRRLAIRCPDIDRQQDDPGFVSFEILLFANAQPETPRATSDDGSECFHGANFRVAKHGAQRDGLPSSVPPASGWLCKFLTGKQTHYSGFLVHKDEDGLQLREDPSSPSSEHSGPLRVVSDSLKSQLHAEGWYPSITRDIRLAYILALSVWQFYDTDWMHSHWTTEEVAIVRLMGGNSYPYIKPSHWGFGRGEDYTPERISVGGIVFYPKIMALGMMMIELFQGPAFGGPDPSATTDRMIRDSQSYFWKMINYGAKWNSDYQEIIRNCFQGALFNKTDNAEARQHIFEEKIVLPLERLFREGVCGERLIRFHTREEASSPKANLPAQQDPKKSAQANSYSSVPRVTETAKQHTTLEVPLSREERWVMSQFNQVNRSIFDNIRETLGEPESMSIAVLDTGFCCAASKKRKYEKRVVWRDFVEPSNNTWKDQDTHGTSIVSLLLYLLPKAKIYVCRIARTQKDLDQPSTRHAISQAIDWAVEPAQNVDVLNLSFGFYEDVREIRQAIKQAVSVKKEKLLVFAAANNYGNEPERFPATMDEVISVRGAGPDGSIISAYDPEPSETSTKAAMFYTLAQEVPCGSSRDMKSGCSIATPILAATAVLFLQYASSMMAQAQEVEESESWRIQALHEKGVMELLFRTVGRKMQNGPYWFVQPRHLFRELDKGSHWFKHDIMAVVRKLPNRT